MTVKDKRRRNETKRFFRLYAGVSGEMSVEDIPVSEAVDLDALKDGDDDPLEVVVEIPVGMSKRGWNYTEQAIKDIVDHVNEHTLNADLGHQKPEDVSNEFRPPVTHWVGARMDEDAAYFRGVVDAAAKDLKRWIRAGRVKQVSIFGEPLLQEASGETRVVGYRPLSIDWTPLDRMGMPTRIVAIGEMEDVSEKETTEEGDEEMTPEELLDELKKMYDNKQITLKMISDMLGLDEEEVAAEMDATIKDKLALHEEVVGVFGEMEDISTTIKQAKKAMEEQADYRIEKIVGEMAEEKIKSPEVRNALKDEKTPIGKMWALHARGIDKSADKETIAGEMDTFLEDEAVKSLINTAHSGPSPISAPTGNVSNTMTKRKKVSIN